ncbi:hypothetical protein ACFC1I_08255 [Microbacterium sp. NPDC056044]|uniref:hypothetical protein n=1 Tax=Microbacterium sp. NPDC056044 TaxID=3345690 RepID=UPI0035DD01BF
MSTPDDPHLEELRALRTRAYGPNADIHEDAAALVRLRELEARATGDGGDASATPLTVDPRMAPTAIGVTGPDSTGHESVEAGEVAVDADEPGGAVAAAESPMWWRRRIPVLWTAAGIVVGVVLGIGLSSLVQPGAPERVAVLDVDAGAEWPNEIFGVGPDDGRRYEEFHGLTVVGYDRTTDVGGSQSCLAVLTAPDGSGFAAGGCGAAAFPANASMEITSLSPQELRDEFPEGTSLRFVREGTQMEVYAAPPGAPRPTP